MGKFVFTNCGTDKVRQKRDKLKLTLKGTRPQVELVRLGFLLFLFFFCIFDKKKSLLYQLNIFFKN